MSGLAPYLNKNLMDLDSENLTRAIENYLYRGIPINRTFSGRIFKLDVQEKDKEYLIEAELPGVSKDEIKIQLIDENLKISVERNETIEKEDKNYIHKERNYTSMQRIINLPNALSEGIVAKLDGGVLTISLPKENKPDTSIDINIE